jgi:hypothetical protein
MDESQIFDSNLYEFLEDEELDEVEFFEILTLDEISKNNPAFLAFSKEEIFNELYSFFKNSNKSDAISEMFFQEKNQHKFTNYVFLTNAERKTYVCSDDHSGELIFKYSELEKTQYTVSQKEKNKIMFALCYDNESSKLRMKPCVKTTFELRTGDDIQEMNILYPVVENDDTNVPILGAYYKRPASSIGDKISYKISSGTKPELINFKTTDGYNDFDKFIDRIKPKISNIASSLDLDVDDFNMDFAHIDALLNSFDSSFDDIQIEDFKVLKTYIETHISKIKPVNIKYNKVPLQKLNIQNNKLSFYERLRNLQTPLNIEDKTKYDELIALLQEEKMELGIPNLLYNNIRDIINAVSSGDTTVEIIIENIMKNREGIVIDGIISNLKEVSNVNVEDYVKNLDTIYEKFSYLQNISRDIYGVKFLDFYNEREEIKQANDFGKYDGIPEVYKNETTFDGTSEMTEHIIQDVPLIKPSTDLEKYWLSTKYRRNVGFVEMLKIILPIIQGVYDISNTNINYELLSDELFKYFAGIPTKLHLLTELFKNNNIIIDDADIQKLVKIKPSIILNSTNTDTMYIEEVKMCNRQFLDILYKMIFTSITWWSLQLQSDIINDTLIFDENSLQISYLDKWSSDGLLTNIAKDGTLAYLSAILEDIFVDIEIYNVPQNISSSVKEILDTTYKNTYELLKEQSVKIRKKSNKGDETRKTLREMIKEMKDSKTARQNKNNVEKLLNDYISALIFMPSYKYQKTHKFLLGCCIQEIGSNFTPYMDFNKMGRTDLITAKLSYAKNRMTNKSSYPLYSIQSKQNTSEDFKIDEQFRVPILEKSNDKTFEIWLNEMRDISLLLPSYIIDEIEKGTSKTENDTISHIRILTKTAGYKNKNDLEKQLFDTTVNRQGVYILMRKTLNSFPTNDENERLLLDMAVSELKLIQMKLKDLQTIFHEYNEKDIGVVNNYILSRSLCLPFNPDISNNNILKSSISVSNNFIQDVSKIVYTTVLKHLNAAKMPSIEENLDFVNKLRETNKDRTLSIMNKKTHEEREIYDQFKQIGIKHEFDAEDIEDTGNNKNNGFEEVLEDDNEHRLGNEDGYDDDTLDNENFGFLYD